MEKKKYRYGAVALGLAVLATALFYGKTGGAGVKTKDSVRIGVSLYREDDTFINTLRQSMEDQAKAYEQDTGIRMILDVLDAKGDQNTQNSQVERFISLGCDVMFINMVDRSAASSIIDKAIEGNVPVIFFNREPVEEDMNRWEKLFYVGADPKAEAIRQGEILAEAYEKSPLALDLNEDGRVSYVMLEGESGHQDSLVRTEWAIQTLKEARVPLEKLAGGIANWERSQAAALTGQWIKDYPDQIELIICNNDDMALGAADTLNRLGILRPVCVVGIDGTPEGLAAVESGQLFGTVQIDSVLYGKTLIRMAAALALGEKMPDDIPLEDGTYFRCPSYAVVGEPEAGNN